MIMKYILQTLLDSIDIYMVYTPLSRTIFLTSLPESSLTCTCYLVCVNNCARGGGVRFHTMRMRR